MRRITRTTTAAISAVTVLAAFTACTDDEPAAESTGTTATEEEMESDEMAAVLGTAASDLGEIVVDGEGMTVYYFDNDEPGSGTSACEGDCLTNWPPVHADGEDPQVEGVTAEVGTITGNDGELQVTLDGRPVYLFVGDTAAGDVAGQGVNDVWWAVAPDGAAVMGDGS